MLRPVGKYKKRRIAFVSLTFEAYFFCLFLELTFFTDQGKGFFFKKNTFVVCVEQLNKEHQQNPLLDKTKQNKILAYHRTFTKINICIDEWVDGEYRDVYILRLRCTGALKAYTESEKKL